MPSTCCCSAKMNVQHGMKCKRGFVIIQHIDLRDLTAKLLSNVYNDAEIKPKLLTVTGESFWNRTANTLTEAKLDIRSRGFGVRDQQVFFDIRLFDSNAKRYINSAFPECYAQNEEEKKRQYNTEASPRWYFQYIEV